ncbi:MAG: hypothetical protein J2P18_01365 [Nocardia sp.]|nr:hypothetical protein [Nocardia sp.]
MNLPARPDDDAPQTPNNGPLCYLHHEDGSWWLVGDDGWPVTPEEFHAEEASAIAAAYFPAIEVDTNFAALDDDAGA